MAKPPERVSIDNLVDLACRDGVEIRPTLLRVLTDLYVQKPIHDADEETQYVELALNLIDAVDAQTRSAVASSLSSYPNAPAAVLRRLAGAGAPPAGGRAEHESAAHEADAPERSELIDLFFTASPEERRLILRNLDVTLDLASEPPARRSLPVAGELLRRLENAALVRNPGEFARVLERALGVSAELAVRITRDNSGEPVVVAAKAIGMHPDALARILIFLNPIIGQSAARIYELAKLYDEISMASAERMLAIWRTSVPPRRADMVRQVRAVIARGAMTGAPSSRTTAASRTISPSPAAVTRPSSSGHAASRTIAPSPAPVTRPAPSERAASTGAPALANPASAPPSRLPDSPGDDLGFWWDERQDVRWWSMLEPAGQEHAASTAAAERAAPAHPSAYAAGQARAHATAGLRTRYLTHDTVYWNDELPDARAASTPAPARAPAERDAPPRKKSGERA